MTEVPTRPTTEDAVADARQRRRRLQESLQEADFDALILASESNFTYCTGYSTPAWAMTARPIVLALTEDTGTAVVGSAEADPLSRACPDLDIVTYTEPTARQVDGVPLLDFAASTVDLLIAHLRGRSVRRVGIEASVPSASGLPYSSLTRLAEGLNATLHDAATLIWRHRQSKTPHEIASLRYVGHAAGRMYAEFERTAEPGMTERELQALVQQATAGVGVDRLGFSLVIAGAGEAPDGPAGNRVWRPGDLLFMDAGLIADGYWSDFSRHYVAADLAPEYAAAYAYIINATRAGRAACRPGATAGDIARAQAAELPRVKDSQGLAGIGRMGHGIGLDLTEPPSVNVVDQTQLVVGSTLTVEPLASFAFGFLSAEEMVAVQENGPELLSPAFPSNLPVLGG